MNCLQFEITELPQPVRDLKQIYHKAIAEKFISDKKRIAKELQNMGIQTILTASANLTVNTINKYLELKARGMI